MTGALNPEWVVMMRSSRDFPCLDLFLGDTGQSERFLPWRGAHGCAEYPGSGFAGYDGYVGTGVWRGGYLREVDHVVYWWKVLALAN